MDDLVTFRLDWGRGPFRVSEEREALRLEIVANPYDDDLRHVYADLAIEEGDPRGEYVRLGLLLDGEEREENARALRRAMEDLCARYGRAIFAEWFGSALSNELPFLLRTFGADHGARQRAGFVSSMNLSARATEQIREALSLSPLEGDEFPMRDYGEPFSIGKARDFHSASERLFATRPVRPRLISSASYTELGALLPAERCGDLVSLRLARSGPDDRAIAHLVRAAPQLRSLRNLDLSPAGANLLTKLTELRVLGVLLPEPIALDDDAFPNLKTLTISGEYENLGEFITQRELRSVELCSGPTPRFLEMLDGAPLSSLTLREIDEASLSVLAGLSLPNLRHLCISARGFGRISHALTNASFGATLRTFEVSYGELSGEQLALLAESDLFAGLESLDLSNNPIGSVGANVLANSKHTKSLKSLKLASARIGKEATRALMNALHALEVLHFHDNGVELSGVPMFAIAQMPHLDSVREIAMGGQYAAASTDALVELARSKNARALRRLRLRAISAMGMRALIASPHLHELGEVGEVEPINAALYKRAQRRFGHRLIVRYRHRRDLREPDLDPWWTPLQ